MTSLYYAAAHESQTPLISPIAAGPRLDILLLDGAITSVAAAIEAIELGDNEACSRAVYLANAIVSQLYLALDTAARPTATESLAQIFNFVLRRLPLVNVQVGTESARQIRTILEPLRDTWVNVQVSLPSDIAAGLVQAVI